MAELKARFVTSMPADDGHRERLWKEFEFATASLRSITPVAAAWIGGSFLSLNDHPSDIDVVYLVRAAEYDAMTEEKKRSVNVFRGDKQLFKRELRVDSYVTTWSPRSSDTPVSRDENMEMAHRGYWDDWFQRKQMAGIELEDARNAVPRRGYLEVLLDDYTA